MSQTLAFPVIASKTRLVLLRLGAYWIDCTLSFLVVILVNLLLSPVNPLLKTIQTGQEPSGWQYHIWVLASASLPIWAYFTFFQSSRYKATPGMLLFKLKLTSLEGERLPLSRALLRTAILLIPFELNHILIVYVYPILPQDQPGIMWMLFAIICLVCGLYVAACFVTPQQQSFHDLAAGSVVSKRS